MTGLADLVRLRVQLRDVKPTAWRRVVIPATIRLDRLHRVVQAAMGWEDAHLWSFHLHGVDYGPETGRNPSVPFAQFRLRPGERFTCVYDFGDWWEHEVRVEAATPADARGFVPRCVGGNGTCPPEDCGGPAGYAEQVGEALGLSASLDLADFAEFGRDLLAAKESGDWSPITNPDRLDDLDRIVRRSQRRLRFTEPFSKGAANDRLHALAGAEQETDP
ncbi:plasmid pRiA4b ORF-3 family protein [Sphingomonas sp. CROZ-RG-20F-R02-07]|uniref:plasmid pRiA4b ORF-3 family protein n=1 Tax=Sphingomonas sp. CROZ-RG-20F-R02-07 TaxID=2914832 RepID=UPI001F592337